jgi:hypothetical protein
VSLGRTEDALRGGKPRLGEPPKLHGGFDAWVDGVRVRFVYAPGNLSLVKSRQASASEATEKAKDQVRESTDRRMEAWKARERTVL